MKLNEEQIARLKSLEQNNSITPDVVIEDAKRKDSPLHGLFQWDKNKAALMQWRDTAREIIASVRVQITTRQITLETVTYMQDPDKAGNEQGYVRTDALARDPERARQGLIDELTRAAGYVSRCRSLALVLGLEAEIDPLMDRILGLQNRLSAAA